MMLTRKLKMGLVIFTMLFVAVVAGSALAERTRDAQGDVANRLTDFQRTASQLRREADTLNAGRNSRVSWETHALHLGNLKDHVNKLGRSLAELEALKPEASQSQRMAIEQARPHLVSIAESTTRAIELLRDRRGSIHFAEYGEAASDIYDHADALNTKMDAILDFEDAKVRLDAMELHPLSSEGS
jgi:hypothetical protein